MLNFEKVRKKDEKKNITKIIPSFSLKSCCDVTGADPWATVDETVLMFYFTFETIRAQVFLPRILSKVFTNYRCYLTGATHYKSLKEELVLSVQMSEPSVDKKCVQFCPIDRKIQLLDDII